MKIFLWSTIALMLTSAFVHATPKSELPRLHQAVISGDLALVERLLNAGADVNQLDTRMGNSPLHIAAQTDHTQILALLIKEGAFINLQAPRSGFTALMIATWYSKPENIIELFKHPELNIELKTPSGAKAEQLIGGWDKQITPSEARRYDKLRVLFAHKRAQQQAMLDSQKILNVIESDIVSEAQKVDQVAALIADGQDVNQRRPVYSNRNDWHTPLLVAAREGYTRLVKLLLAHNADQTIPGYPMNAIAMHKAGYMGHADIVRLLVGDRRAPLVLNTQGPNNGYTPLHDAIWHGHSEAAVEFIKGGAQLQLKTYENDTPLDLAERYQYTQIVEALLNQYRVVQSD
ncbi:MULTISPECIES: ankyrin repeat domain-containing protein [unclassified Pseudoalteromonas]|uniref:ankyrin repeat domain-containing protein n=1 Tax=unclassified Pseudoalteromonas TaxID=194690 RepID=UPI0020968148|nr:ankyrin repeat domain-containing protein [Pseudoalteromonas sp. XMcav2-N]MCO7191223.1 ankyrin repeat domain-containing protein [Pseudoalteromonas sp. XMcav2-N]